jgi:predicted O-linked N-acetylglucosamine transferase (SPINDLY family)
MIADSLPAYEQMALRLATDPAALRSIREKLARNRTTSPAFDTARFTRNLEAVLLSIHERRSD